MAQERLSGPLQEAISNGEIVLRFFAVNRRRTSTYRSKVSRKSAAELMVELNADPDYVARMRQRERLRAEEGADYQRVLAPVLKDLEAIGFNLRSLDELRRGAVDYPAAVPILLGWLAKTENLDLKEDIVRTLSLPWVAEDVAKAFNSEIQRTDIPSSDGLRWAIANGLAVTAGDSIFDQLVAVATDKRYGKAREMLVLALGNCFNPRAVDVLIDLLTDEQVVGHAVMALGKLKSKAARPHIQKLSDYPIRWIRVEVAKTLEKIDRHPDI
jgi:HEAT repeat protein